MSSTVQVGSPADTGPTYTLTVTRDANDSVTDWTTCTGLVLLLADGTTHPVTTTTATAATWTGTVRYQGWFNTAGVYTARARATFADGTVLTIPSELAFTVGS